MVVIQQGANSYNIFWRYCSIFMMTITLLSSVELSICHTIAAHWKWRASQTRNTQLICEDGALIGAPDAISITSKIINDWFSQTGLHLRWKKWHLYSTSTTIDPCRAKANPFSPDLLTEDITSENLVMIMIRKALIRDFYQPKIGLNARN